MPAAAAALAAPGPEGRPFRGLRKGRGRPLTILHLITRLDRGGSSECTLLQAIGAARRGHSVVVGAGPSDAPSPLLAAALRQPRLRLHPVRHLARALRPLADLCAWLELRALVRATGCDLVHTHTSKAGALGRLAALGLGVPVVHQPHGHLFYGYYGRIGSALVIAAERLLAPAARAHIALSRRGVEEHVSRGVGSASRFRVIRSGIDLSRFRRAPRRREACRGRLGFAPEDFVVGALGRLEPVKGAEDLLDGFARAAAGRPNLRLYLGGDGPLAGALLLRAAASGCGERVIVARDWVSPEETLPAFDAFVMASRNEGMGRALVEAMACRLPVIGCAVGGIPEVLDEGRDGLLVPPGDPAALARAIGTLADEPEKARALGSRGRRRAVRFGAGRMTRDLLRLYDEVLA